jgi:hypothetical protein
MHNDCKVAMQTSAKKCRAGAARLGCVAADKDMWAREGEKKKNNGKESHLARSAKLSLPSSPDKMDIAKKEPQNLAATTNVLLNGIVAWANHVKIWNHFEISKAVVLTLRSRMHGWSMSGRAVHFILFLFVFDGRLMLITGRWVYADESHTENGLLEGEWTFVSRWCRCW